MKQYLYILLLPVLIIYGCRSHYETTTEKFTVVKTENSFEHGKKPGVQCVWGSAITIKKSRAL